MRLTFVTLLGVIVLGCADVKGIENQKQWGPVRSMIDLFTSCQLLETSDGPVLFDACWRADELKARLKERGFTPADVVAVLVTHGHADHVGGLASLVNARRIGLADEAPTLEKHAAGLPLTQTVVDGERLQFGEHEVRVFSVPGHTAGSAAYLVGGTLVLGDSGLFTGSGKFAMVPEERSADPAQVVRSIVQLGDRLTAEGLTVDAILPAHSGGIAGRVAFDAFIEANR